MEQRASLSAAEREIIEEAARLRPYLARGTKSVA
jgi:hypothetical protein